MLRDDGDAGCRLHGSTSLYHFIFHLAQFEHYHLNGVMTRLLLVPRNRSSGIKLGGHEYLKNRLRFG